MKETIHIKKIGINGEGIGYKNKKVVFVPGALPEEKVSVDVSNEGKSYSTGKLLDVLTPNPKRVKPTCANYPQCLGCSLLHVEYKETLLYKKDAIVETFSKYTGFKNIDKIVDDVVGKEKLDGFINSVSLPIVGFNKKITFGIYQRGSKYLTIMNDCMKYSPIIKKTLNDLAKVLNDNKCRDYNDHFKTGLRFVMLRSVGDEVQIVFITGTDGVNDKVVEDITKLGYVSSIFMSVNTSSRQDFKESGYTKLWGNSKAAYVYDDKKYIYSIKTSLPEDDESFDKVTKIVQNELKDSNKIIALYDNLGIISLSSKKEMVSILDNKGAYNDAVSNKKFLKCDNVDFVIGKVSEKVVLYAKRKIYDTFYLDLTDHFISDKLKETLRYSNAKKVVILASQPYGIAKDIHDLQKYFKLTSIKGIDTKPYTSNVSVILVLERK
ncbi:MAG: TRAM domain-containing protein [Thomasclavelia sp.]|nr:TRAM domain-containing protein [Thomasclavelia sp.]